MAPHAFLLLSTIAVVTTVGLASPSKQQLPLIVDLLSDSSSPTSHSLAAREVRHYIYSSHGVWSPIVGVDDVINHGANTNVNASAAAELLVVGSTKHERFQTGMRAIMEIAGYGHVEELDAEVTQFLETHEDNHAVVTLALDDSVALPHVVGVLGASDLAALYGAYEFAESVLGARFYIHGEFVPSVEHPEGEGVVKVLQDSPIRSLATPTFNKRGLQPFHDFTSGPDWWNANDYKMVVSQMTKMKMNFLGLHSYPMREPLVWVGTTDNLTESGDVLPSGAYAATWATTSENGWGLQPRNTSTYAAGASAMFPSECYGSPAQPDDLCVQANLATPDRQAEVFNNAADMMGDVFAFAKQLGVQTAVGTEVPLTVPSGVDQEAALEGAFLRIQKKFPPDFYWHWTPEGWEWGKVSVNSTATQQAVKDILSSVDARAATAGANFSLATCGWEVGPADDKTYLDRVLPADIVALSSIDQRVGWWDVDPDYVKIQREKWVIPWMEDDPHLIGSELWANRTLTHAKYAASYGIQGLLGITWRTLETSLTIRALAQAPWQPAITVEELMLDFTNTTFGPTVAQRAADILVGLDSWATKDWTAPPAEGCVDCTPKMPTTGFTCCARFTVPTALIDLTPFAFADEFFALREEVASQPTDAAQRLMFFDQWAFQFRYHRGIAEVQNAAYYVQQNFTAAAALPTPAARKQAAQTACVAALQHAATTYESMMTDLLTYASTEGELGMIAQNENMNYLLNFNPLITGITSLIVQSPVGDYIGSFHDDTTRRVPFGPGASRSNLTQQECADTCYTYPLYALQYEGNCFCGSDLALAESLGPDPACVPPNTAGWCNALYNHTPVPAVQLPQPSKNYTGPDRLFVLSPRTVGSAKTRLDITAIALPAGSRHLDPASQTVELHTRRPPGSGAYTTTPMEAKGRGWFTASVNTLQSGSDFEYYVTAAETNLTYPAGATIVVVVA